MKHAKVQLKSIVLMAEYQSALIEQINDLLKDNEKMLVRGGVSMFWEAHGDITYQSATRMYTQQFFLYRIIEVLD